MWLLRHIRLLAGGYVQHILRHLPLGHIVDVATVAILVAALTVAIAMFISIKASSQFSTCFSGCDAFNFRMAAGSGRPAAFGIRTNKHMLRISAYRDFVFLSAFVHDDTMNETADPGQTAKPPGDVGQTSQVIRPFNDSSIHKLGHHGMGQVKRTTNVLQIFVITEVHPVAIYCM